MTQGQNRYSQIIEKIFFRHHKTGSQQFEFERAEIEEVARKLKIKLPKNLGDVIYTFRYRGALPVPILKTATAGTQWIIRPAGKSRYRFAVTTLTIITPKEMMAETKIPDSTPGVITLYALSDEQALLAKLRYNRMVDIFTGVTCYSLQNHLRTSVAGMGQVETDEIYIGLDKRGAHYVLPIQAKGSKDNLNVVQIEQDISLCKEKFPALICRPVGAQFLKKDLIVLFEFEEGRKGVSIVTEKHYRLVTPEEISDEDLHKYQSRSN